MHELQAAAAVGQMGLAQCYETLLRAARRCTRAQVLLTHADLADRAALPQRALDAAHAARARRRSRSSTRTTPWSPTRSSSATTTRSARWSTNLVEADALVILTDQAGLYDADPRKDPDATLVEEARRRRSGARGDGRRRRQRARPSGGMLTKVLAAQARRAQRRAHRHRRRAASPTCWCASPRGERIGTLLSARRPCRSPRASSGSPITCSVRGAARARRRRGARAARATARACCRSAWSRSTGEFERGEVVGLPRPDGREIARGLANYSAAEARRIMRRPSARSRRSSATWTSPS